MLAHSTEWIHAIARVIELVGIAIIVLGIAGALVRFVFNYREAAAYAKLRQHAGKVILLGLEILVAADIILTVATEPTLENVAVLGLVVLIRTFLSWSLEVELEGKWPWQAQTEGMAVHEDAPMR